MGSWDDTCMLSQLPISYQTRALFVPLRAVRLYFYDESAGGSVHSDAHWCPAGIPWVGVYDTYGSIEKPRALSRYLGEHALGFLKKWGIEGPLDDILRRLERAEDTKYRDYMADPADQDLRMGRALIREDVWDWVLSYEYEDPHDFAASIEGRPARKLTRKLFHDDAVAWAEGYKALFPKESNDELVKREGVKALSGLFMRLSSYDDETRFSNQVLRTFHGAYWASSWTLHLREMFREKPLDDLKADLFALADVAFVHKWMEITRHSWYPPSGKGSQDSLLKMHEDFHASLTKIAEKQRLREECE